MKNFNDKHQVVITIQLTYLVRLSNQNIYELNSIER